MRGKRRGDLVALSLWAMIATAIWLDGGFGEVPQVVFVVMVGLVVLLAAALLPAPTGQAIPVFALLAFGVVSCLSAVWTVADPAAAIRAGSVAIAYAGVAWVAATISHERHLERIAIPLLVVVTACALIGLWGAATASPPWAYRIEGAWRPAGPLEYPSALATMAILAIPFAVRSASGTGRVGAVAAGFSLAAAMSTLVLVESRLGTVLGSATVLACVMGPSAAFGTSRRWRAGFTAGSLAAALAAFALVGGLADGRVGRSTGLAVLLLAVLLAAAVASPILAATFARFRPSRLPATPGRAVLIGAAVVAIAVFLAVVGEREGPGIQGYGGPLHGREAQWDAALNAFSERPLLGFGADAYYSASADDQGRDVSLYAHSLPLEAAAEVGVVGLLCIVGLYGSIAMIAWRTRRFPGVWLLLPGILGFLLVSLVDWQWHLAAVGAVWAVLVGLLCEQDAAT